MQLLQASLRRRRARGSVKAVEVDEVVEVNAVDGAVAEASRAMISRSAGFKRVTSKTGFELGRARAKVIGTVARSKIVRVRRWEDILIGRVVCPIARGATLEQQKSVCRR